MPTSSSCNADELVVVPRGTHEPGTRCLAEGNAEEYLGTYPDHRFVQVIDSLDEMRLPDDDVSVLGFGNSDDLERNRTGCHVALPSEWIDHTNMLSLFPAAVGFHRGTGPRRSLNSHAGPSRPTGPGPKVLPYADQI
jgi:hypothetical protein